MLTAGRPASSREMRPLKAEKVKTGTAVVLQAGALVVERLLGCPAAGVGGGLADQGVSGDPCEQLNDLQRRLLGEIDDNPVSLDCLVSRMGVPVPAALKEISGLEAMGFLATVEGRVMRI